MEIPSQQYQPQQFPQQQFQAQTGGMFPRITAGGDGVIANPMPGQAGAMLVVDTSGGAMAQMGLEQGGGGRRIRRFQGASMAPMMSSVMPTPPSGGSGQITVTRLE